MTNDPGYVGAYLRALVQQLMAFPQANSDVLLCVADALRERADDDEAAGLRAHAIGLRRLAAEVAALARSRAG